MSLVFFDSQCRKCDIAAIEKVQKRATKILPLLKNLRYTERLKICKLTTLHYTQLRGDISETCKIVSGKYNRLVAPTMNKGCSYLPRENDKRLQKSHVKYNLRKYCVTNRVVNRE